MESAQRAESGFADIALQFIHGDDERLRALFPSAQQITLRIFGLRNTEFHAVNTAFHTHERLKSQQITSFSLWDRDIRIPRFGFSANFPKHTFLKPELL